MGTMICVTKSVETVGNHNGLPRFVKLKYISEINVCQIKIPVTYPSFDLETKMSITLYIKSP
jgi:hypothetical protein